VHDVDVAAETREIERFLQRRVPAPNDHDVLSLKKKPSHVAQVEIPRPISFDSPGKPRSFAVAPVAMTTVCASNVCLSAVTTKGLRLKSTAVTSSLFISVPK